MIFGRLFYIFTIQCTNLYLSRIWLKLNIFKYWLEQISAFPQDFSWRVFVFVLQVDSEALSQFSPKAANIKYANCKWCWGNLVVFDLLHDLLVFILVLGSYLMDTTKNLFF